MLCPRRVARRVTTRSGAVCDICINEQAAFTPEELRGANPEDVQDSLISEGWDVIGYLATEPEDDEEEEA